MNVSTVETPVRAAPNWLLAAGALGTLWNVYGLYQFVGTFTPSGQAAITAGMTAAQAELYLSLPAWISVVFAIGVAGGLAGSIALLLRRRLALPIFAASLAGYVLLFAGDTYYGVFEAIPSQLAILAFVVLVAAVLLAAAWRAGRAGLLR